MSEEEMMARLQALTQQINELREIVRAFGVRLSTAEQSLAQAWGTKGQ